jgi:mRNA interferase MazF
MLTSGDVVELDLGAPAGREAGFRHPAVIVTAQEVLDASASVIHVVPLTSSIRGFGSEVRVIADSHSGLAADSAAQCQHIRSVATGRVDAVRGNVGSATLSEIRQVLGLLLDID